MWSADSSSSLQRSYLLTICHPLFIISTIQISPQIASQAKQQVLRGAWDPQISLPGKTTLFSIFREQEKLHYFFSSLLLQLCPYLFIFHCFIFFFPPSGFNAAVAGCFFAIETVLRPLRAENSPPFTTAMIILASVISSTVSNVLLGEKPAFTVPVYELKSAAGIYLTLTGFVKICIYIYVYICMCCLLICIYVYM